MTYAYHIIHPRIRPESSINRSNQFYAILHITCLNLRISLVSLHIEKSYLNIRIHRDIAGEVWFCGGFESNFKGGTNNWGRS